MIFVASFLEVTGYSPIESILKLIGLILLCAIVIAASFFTTKFIGKRQAGMVGDSNFKSLEVYRLSQNKYLQLVQIGSRFFVLAVCKDTVMVVTELKEEEIVIRKNDKNVSFKDILSKVSAGRTSDFADNEKTPEAVNTDKEE